VQVLADEMGLGKTLEVIALVLANRPATHPAGGAPAATAPAAGSPLLSGGTLVVCPPALLSQWRSEIAAHTAPGALRVEVYEGVHSLLPHLDDDGDDAGARPGGARRGRPGGAKRLTPAERELEFYERQQREYASLRGAPEGETAESVALRARVAARAAALAAADVVLTSFDVLQNEVHYTPESRSQRSMRAAKRYVPPECPLLLVAFHRVVADEAQMASPLSAAGGMLMRLAARHRWCVTGTPIGSARELADVQGLLAILGHNFGGAAEWRRLVAAPLRDGAAVAWLAEGGGAGGGREGTAARRAWRLLRRTLRPLVWRNSKDVVRLEHALPPRALHEARLAFQPGEAEFFEELLGRARGARAKQRALHTQLRHLDAELEASAAGAAAADARKRRRGVPAKLEAARAQEVAVLLELRLASTHPQLTQYWRSFGNAELQLGVGGALGMDEIMQRLVDKGAREQQDAERALCGHLVTLAMVLLGKTGRGAAAATAAAGDEDDDAAGSPSAKRRRRASQAAPSPEAQAEALALLELAYIVGEKGVGGLTFTIDTYRAAPEPEMLAEASWRAWKRVQISAAEHLTAAYRAAGRDFAPDSVYEHIESKVRKRARELRENADKELAKAESRAKAVRRRVDELAEAMARHAADAEAAGFPREWGAVGGNAAGWLAELQEQIEEQAVLERADLEDVGGVMGTRVAKALAAAEKRLGPEHGALEAHVQAARVGAAVRELSRALEGLAGDANEDHAALRWRMGELCAMLPAFKDKLLRSQHGSVLPTPWPKMREPAEPAEVAAEFAAEGAKGNVGAGPSGLASSTGVAAGTAEPSADSSDVAAAAWRQVADDRALAKAAAAEEGSNEPDFDMVLMLEAEPRHTEDAALLAAVGAEFIPAAGWRGHLRGYAFTTGAAGLGYYADAKAPAKLPLAERVHLCGQALLRALREHQPKLQRQCPPAAAAAFAACAPTAVEARFAAAAAQVELTRALRERHTAECALVLKLGVKEEVDAEVAAARAEAPFPLRAPEALRLKIEALKATAKDRRDRKAFMMNKLAEGKARTAAAAAGAPTTTTGANGAPTAAAATDEAAGPASPSVPGPAALRAARPSVDCPVCLKAIKTDARLFSECGHAFCLDCTNRLFTSAATAACPVCRKATHFRAVVRVAPGGGARDGGLACDPDALADTALQAASVQGAWSIKVAALVRRLAALAAAAPAEKALVFSTFPEALRLVGTALKANGIAHVELLGGGRGRAAKDALNAFREHDDVRVFLLSHRAGAQGLTLVRANHVFLLEPALDPAVEQQAVARVHRIGQARPVRVVRLLAGPVEEEVLRVQTRRQALFGEEHGGAAAGGDVTDDDGDVTAVAACALPGAVDADEAERLLDAVLG
jgi:E3 ubiquitin-protein ligase SHPRH